MRHFQLKQFTYSTSAIQHGIDNSIPADLISNINALVNVILDPLIDAWGDDVYVTSGFRCYALNKAIGGSTTSAHSYALAADLVPKNGKIEEFKQFTMKWLLNNHIMFDQFINEYSGNKSWVHIGFKNGSGQQRRQFLLYKNKKYTVLNPNLYVGKTDVLPESSQTTIPDVSVSNGDNDILQGKSVYYKEINWAAIKANGIFEKDGNNELILDTDGNPVISDNYLYEANETESDQIQEANEFPNEPIEINLDAIDNADTEQVKGISFNPDGSYAVSHSKSLQEIMVMVQEWWQLVQRLKNMDFENLINYSSVKEETDEEGNVSINAMVYMKAAFDMYGHAYRTGMTCPICGKKARYLPPGGYCSVQCLLKAVKDKSIAFLMSPNDKYKWLQDLIAQLCAILDHTTLLINAVVMIPDIIKELAALPEEYKVFVQNKIAEGFAELQELIQKAMVYKNKLLEKLLKPINFGIIAKPVAMAMQVINVIQEALSVAQEAFQLAFDAVEVVIQKLINVPIPTGLAIPAESFAWAFTFRSIMSIYPIPSPDAGKIFVVLPGGSGVPLQGIKPLLPSALQNINMEAIDATIQGIFPPLTPVDYYLPPELFQIRYLFSDQSDLVSQVRQQLEDFLKCGPDYIPNFENLLPIKSYKFAGQDVPLPNIGYLWFLLGLLDAWAPHSKALVGSFIHPEV